MTEELECILQRVEDRQKHLEELSSYLHELESHLALVFAFSPDLILLSNDQGKILRVNYSVEQILGYAPKEIIGTRVWDYIHPNDIEETLKVKDLIMQNKFFASKERRTFTNHWRRKDGSYARLVWRFAYYDNNNQWMIKFATDFTHIEADNLESTQLIVNCINRANAGIVITDCQKENNPIVFANPKFEEMSGFTKEEILGENPRILNQECRGQKALDYIRTSISRGEGCEVLLKNFRPNGECWFNHLLIEPVIENGKVINYIGSSRNVTEHIYNGTIMWDPNTERGFGRKDS